MNQCDILEPARNLSMAFLVRQKALEENKKLCMMFGVFFSSNFLVMYVVFTWGGVCQGQFLIQ